jgi:hypothetical protein
MAAHFDRELTSMAAEILREAVQSYGRADVERWAASYLTGSFQAMTGALPAMSGGFPAMTGGFPAITGGFPAITGGIPSMTGAFQAIANGDATVRLKKVFRLPRTLPAVRLPTQAELAAMARSAPLMVMLERLARWVGAGGRRVTEDGELPDADAAQAAGRLGVQPQYLPYLWAYALAVGWFELHDEPGEGPKKAVIGQTAWRWADIDDSGTLHVWAAVFAAVLAGTLDVAAATDADASHKLEFQGQGVAMAVMLFMTRRAGLSRGQLEDLLMKGAIGDRPSSRARKAWDAWVDEHGDPASSLLGELSALRAVTVPDTAEDAVSLLPLALWALREQLLLDGIEIPVLAAASPRMTASYLVALADGVSDAEFESEVAAWMAARSPDRAARELLAFAAFSGAQPRLAAVNLVRRIGVDAHRAWWDAMQRPELRGYARIALSMMAADLPESSLPMVLNPNPDDLTWVAADLLALACGDEDPDPEQIAEEFNDAIPPGEESWIFGLMSQSSQPEVAQVLTALGRYHPDRRVAKEARHAARAAAKNATMARAGRGSAHANGR